MRSSSVRWRRRPAVACERSTAASSATSPWARRASPSCSAVCPWHRRPSCRAGSRSSRPRALLGREAPRRRRGTLGVPTYRGRPRLRSGRPRPRHLGPTLVTTRARRARGGPRAVALGGRAQRAPRQGIRHWAERRGARVPGAAPHKQAFVVPLNEDRRPSSASTLRGPTSPVLRVRPARHDPDLARGSNARPGIGRGAARSTRQTSSGMPRLAGLDGPQPTRAHRLAAPQFRDGICGARRRPIAKYAQSTVKQRLREAFARRGSDQSRQQLVAGLSRTCRVRGRGAIRRGPRRTFGVAGLAGPGHPAGPSPSEAARTGAGARPGGQPVPWRAASLTPVFVNVQGLTDGLRARKAGRRGRWLARADRRRARLEELLDDPIIDLLWRRDRLEPVAARATVLMLRALVRGRTSSCP